MEIRTVVINDKQTLPDNIVIIHCSPSYDEYPIPKLRIWYFRMMD